MLVCKLHIHQNNCISLFNNACAYSPVQSNISVVATDSKAVFLLRTLLRRDEAAIRAGSSELPLASARLDYCTAVRFKLECFFVSWFVVVVY